MRRVKFSALIAAALAALFVASIGFACYLYMIPLYNFVVGILRKKK